MLLKLAALSLIAVTTHLEQAGQGQLQWVYSSGANKGYVCALMQMNGTSYDVYLPAVSPAPVQRAGAPSLLTAVPWQHYAKQADALTAVGTYCPTSAASQHPE